MLCQKKKKKGKPIYFFKHFDTQYEPNIMYC